MKKQLSALAGLVMAAAASALPGGPLPTGSPQFRGPTPAKHGRKKSGYGRALANHFADKQLRRMAQRDMHPLSDEHGAFTQVGRDPLRQIDITGHEVRRKWLAGISAQRGY